MSRVSESLDRILGPRTLATATDAINRWDREAKTLPLLSEQIRLMQDGPQTWSVTHCWPSVREAMISIGLVRSLESHRHDGWVTPVTEITDLGREVRSHLTRDPTTA